MSELNQKQLVTLALYALNGVKESVDTENIAMKVAEIAPGIFSWRKFKQNIDLESVRKAIAAAGNIDNYVVGSHKNGWMLSPIGLKFSKNNLPEKWSGYIKKRPDKEQAQIQREKDRLMNTDAYHYYLSHNEHDLSIISKTMADDFFRLNNYIDGQTRINKITKIQNLFSNDPELGPLIKILAPIAQKLRS